MPLSATMEDIKAYQVKVDKNEITSSNLPECPGCHSGSQTFKFHAHRERRFLIIAKLVVEAVFCVLVRFRCPKCGKTFTSYPDFAMPYKHYTRQTIEYFSSAYVEDDQKTYESAVMTDNGTPEYFDKVRTLAPSTIHHWVSALANLIIVYQALTTSLHEKLVLSLGAFAPMAIPKRKYKTDRKKACLLLCRRFFMTEPFFKRQFHRLCNNILIHLI
ncbi:MAG: DUF6431 domain-containing protein [Desulfobacula sp.]|jgi:ribosomal protein S27AE|nr:DUF6431 domain-containing protein [Desulfobacula sp.]